MNHTSFLILSFLSVLKLYHNIATCFQLKNTPYFSSKNEFASGVQNYSNKRAGTKLKKPILYRKRSLVFSVNKREVYEHIEKYVSNACLSCNRKNDYTNNLDNFIPHFPSSPIDWDKIVVNDTKNKDTANLINFLYTEYKKAYVVVHEKTKSADNAYNSEKINSLLASLGSVTVDDMKVDEFFKHLEICYILLKYCKDNYVSFSFIKNEMANIMNKIIKHSRNYLHDECMCDKIKNEFVNIHGLIKEIKKNDSIRMNIESFLSVLSSSTVLNNNNIIYFLTEIFTSLNILLRNNPDLVNRYNYIISPHFFFLCIFSLYSYNVSKARFYYFLLLIHNKTDLINLGEKAMKYDNNLNYSVYRRYVINSIFDKEKKEYESTKNAFIENKSNVANAKKINEAHIDNLNKDLSKDLSNEEEKNILPSDKEELLINGCRRIQLKELYDNVIIKILLFYVFLYFSDLYFCVIILLNLKNLVKEKKQDDNATKIINYLFFILLDNLYSIRDYSKIILLLSLFKRSFSSFSDERLRYVKKITNSVMIDNKEDDPTDMSKLVPEISESIKKIENEKKLANKISANNLCEMKNDENYLNKNKAVVKEEIKEETTKTDSAHVGEEEEKSFVNDEEGKNIIAINPSSMKDKFNKYLLRLLKNKEYDKIESLEKRDNLYVNNRTYSLFIQAFLNNHKYDKVYKVYKKMKLRKIIPIKYLNAKNLIHSFKKCDVHKGDVLNELQLISKSYLNLYFSKDSYFVLSKTMLYKHMCDYLKKKCDMKIIIDIFNINELLKYFIKFKSFINIKKLYFLLLKYSYVKTYKTYLLLIRFFNNLNYEHETEAVIPEAQVGGAENGEDEETGCKMVKGLFEKNTEIYRDIINLRKNKLSYYICNMRDVRENLNLFNKVYQITQKGKYDMSLFVLSNFIVEYIFFEYGSDDILECEMSNINNILNIFFESISLFFYKQNYGVALNIYFFLLLFLNYYVTRYTKKDIQYSSFLKKNILNFFLSSNYEVIKVNKDEIYSYIPKFILNIISFCVNHLKNANKMREIVSKDIQYDSHDFIKNDVDSVCFKNIMYIFLLLKNNTILSNGEMEKDIYNKQHSDKQILNTINASTDMQRNYLYKDIIEKNYKEEKGVGEENETSPNSINVANVFVKLKHTIGTNKMNEDSLKDFLFNKLKMYAQNGNTDSLINILKDIFFTYKNIIYLNSRNFLHIYENLNTIYDNVIAATTIVFFMENKKSFKEVDTTLNCSEEHAEVGNSEINIHEFISMLKCRNEAYFKDVLNRSYFFNILKNYENFIHMCIYFDLNKKKVDNVINFVEMSKKCGISLSTETLVDVFSLYLERKMNNLIFNEFEIFSASKSANNFELYFIVMKAAYFEENVRMALKVFTIVLDVFNLKGVPLNFFECILLILKRSGKFKDLYESIDKLHRELINFEKNEQFCNIQDLVVDIKRILLKYERETL
ncbi:hypothetical protein, conserved [Plasmodium ovale curtisi]|uniref:Heptatricopeptide repeat-containing protein n=1 Tax=Plasmodium ovale curtisi TaxID=864141 RepID=A0A1A8VLM2_PLAOA|nr:hypothetical protein, conserved [Plasmodium ovale curtisi]